MWSALLTGFFAVGAVGLMLPACGDDSPGEEDDVDMDSDLDTDMDVDMDMDLDMDMDSDFVGPKVF